MQVYVCVWVSLIFQSYHILYNILLFLMDHTHAKNHEVNLKMSCICMCEWWYAWVICQCACVTIHCRGHRVSQCAYVTVRCRGHRVSWCACVTVHVEVGRQPWMSVFTINLVLKQGLLSHTYRAYRLTGHWVQGFSDLSSPWAVGVLGLQTGAAMLF